MTIKEIAQLAGVSRGTVDRVLHKRGRVKPEIQLRVEEIIRQTDFSPNIAASALKRSSNSLRLGILLPSLRNQFYAQVTEGLERAITHYAQYGVTAQVQELEELTANSQIRAIEEMLETGMDGLILTAINTPDMVRYINNLTTRIPVITFNTDFTNSRRLCFVGQEHFSAGRTAGNLLCNSLHRAGHIAALISYQSILAHTQRVDGLRAVLAESLVDATLLSVLETAESDEKAYHIVRDLIQNDPALVAIYVAGGGQVGAANALADSGRAADILMICYDLLPKTVAHLKAHVVDYTIGQQPFLQGYLPISILYEYLALGYRPESEHLYTSIDIRLCENADFNGMEAMARII